MPYDYTIHKYRTAITFADGLLVSLIAGTNTYASTPITNTLASCEEVELALPQGPGKSVWPCAFTLLPPQFANLFESHYDNECHNTQSDVLPLAECCNVAPYVPYQTVLDIIHYLTLTHGSPTLTVHSVTYDPPFRPHVSQQFLDLISEASREYYPS